ncbi:MAG: hypothetical protein FJ398_23650 [Verrucomicrobia bacterium]|nr:hypothetical protein [Verrucomicrobiota bacterium]
MNTLAEIIRREIAQYGPMPFARFMELALYHSSLGYYEREAETVGRGGDFFTNVSVGSVFGELLAFQFARWLDELKVNPAELNNWQPVAPLPPHEPGSAGIPAGAVEAVALAGKDDGVPSSQVQGFNERMRSENCLLARNKWGEDRGEGKSSENGPPLPNPLLPLQGRKGENQVHRESRLLLQIVEAGAHDGRLALDVLSWFCRHRADLLTQLEYWILEPSTDRQRRQSETLREFDGRFRWFSSWESIPPQSIRGVLFSNELLDSFPVHRLGWDAGERRWFEWAVSWEEGRFGWVKLPTGKHAQTEPRQTVSGPVLPPELAAALPDGFTSEISPAAEAWWTQAASRLARGKLLTIDYGLLAEEFFAPHRANGTLRAYHRHQVSSDLLGSAGEQDLTSHVNFGALQQQGEDAGLRTEGLLPQSRFLTEIVKQIERSPQSFATWTPARLRQLQTLVHPEHLGRPFQLLIQSR